MLIAGILFAVCMSGIHAAGQRQQLPSDVREVRFDFITKNPIKRACIKLDQYICYCCCGSSLYKSVSNQSVIRHYSCCSWRNAHNLVIWDIDAFFEKNKQVIRYDYHSIEHENNFRPKTYHGINIYQAVCTIRPPITKLLPTKPVISNIKRD